jgi:hypothetical protein
VSRRHLVALTLLALVAYPDVSKGETGNAEEAKQMRTDIHKTIYELLKMKEKKAL